MGCAPSQPKSVEPLNGKNGDSLSSPASDGGRQTLKRQDSGRSNGSSKRRGRARGGPIIAPNTSQHSNANGHAINGEHQSPASVAPASDPRWIRLWQSHQELLLDPADIHATMEACMARVTNRFSVTEITFLQRKIRSIVRASHQLSQDQKHSRVTNILRSSANSSQEQETILAAEKHHLLSNHVVRKFLPKLPVTTLQESPSTSYSLIADNVYVLGLFLHESLWDRVAETAACAAKEAGAEMDVNRYQLPQETPSPVPATSEDCPEVPAGISLHALTFLMGLALRKFRIWVMTIRMRFQMICSDGKGANLQKRV